MRQRLFVNLPRTSNELLIPFKSLLRNNKRKKEISSSVNENLNFILTINLIDELLVTLLMSLRLDFIKSQLGKGKFHTIKQ